MNRNEVAAFAPGIKNWVLDSWLEMFRLEILRKAFIIF